MLTARDTLLICSARPWIKQGGGKENARKFPILVIAMPDNSRH